MDIETREKIYYQMALVRFFEERVFELFSNGKLSGTTHCCIGQEADAVSVINHLGKDDIVVSNHRCHGHYLVRTGDVEGLMAELMGRPDGICGGRGGSQHLCKDNFYTNGILGSTVPLAAGMAFAEKKKKSNAVTALFMGDGAFGEGVVYETFNMVSLLQLPILIVVENNFYAQSTPLALNCAGDFLGRARSFNISAAEIKGDDPEQLFDLFGGLIRTVREKGSPHIQVIHTYRFCPHSKGDDHRSKEEVERHRAMDPFRKIGKRLEAGNRLRIERCALERIDKAVSAVTKI